MDGGTNTQPAMQNYRIEGLDCAQCANEIEAALRRIDGFDNAVVSFATETIRVPSGELARAQAVVSTIEPGATIVAGGDRDTHADRSREAGATDRPATRERRQDAWRIARIATAVVLTTLGIAFESRLHATPFHVAEYAVFGVAYLLSGAQVLLGAARNIVRGRVFDEMFLMSVATLGAIAIHELAEAVAVMLFYSVGEYIQDRAVARSRRSITSLVDLRPEYARLLSPDEGEDGTGELRQVDPERVAPGSIIEVRPGERVPLDGVVVTGESSFDTSALTGEPVPRLLGPGSEVLSGYVNDTATVRLRVTTSYGESTVSRVLDLVENAASRKAPTEKFVSRFARVYTPIIVAIAAVVAFLPPLVVPGAELSDWLHRALVIIVISCPCALVISVPLGYFGGIGAASRHGILIKGANYIDALKDVSAVVFDKTGTLTRGVFKVTSVVPRNGYAADELLRAAALAESHSAHPIARSIREAFEFAAGDAGNVTGVADHGETDVNEVREEKGYGVVARADGHTYLAGSDRLLHREAIDHTDCDAEGTVVYVATDGAYMGHLVIADELRPAAIDAVAELRRAGIRHVAMLTGDNRMPAERVAREVGIDTVSSELLPDEKVAAYEAIAEAEVTSAAGVGGAARPAKARGRHAVAFVGDGINDAPVLMRSDVGFAMGGLGSDAAIEAADIVLMNDALSGVPRSIEIARHTRTVVLQNIVFALLVKAVFLALGAFGVATMWEAVIADVGVSLLAVLNSLRTLAVPTLSGSVGKPHRPE